MLGSFNWFLPGALAGSAQPGLLSGLEEDLAMARDQGISLIVTLTEKPLCLPATGPAFEQLHLPVQDMGTPQPRPCAQLCASVVEHLHAGRRALLHCKGGLGRTGMVAASVLVTLGRTPENAVRQVRALNPRYIQTEAQEKFVHVLAAYLGTEPPVADPRPDPAFYSAMGGDEMLRRVLAAFYERVFLDPVLAPFFAHTDLATVRGKQAAFMRRAFLGAAAGEYMGQRPRNAHHAMVISHAQFNHRQALMKQVLEEHGLSAAQVAKWQAVEEAFRVQIVKDAPQPLHYRGTQVYWATTPTVERLDVATLCDRCAAEVPAGDPLHMVGDQALCGVCTAA
jgi:truncated hemoglobin YjbI